MLGQNFLVDARLVIIALDVGGGGEPDQVFITGFILGQENQVVVNVATPASAGFLFQAASRGDINFATDNGLDPLVQRRLVKINGAVENAVVGDAERGKFQFVRFFHQFVQTAGPIEQGKLAVQMEVNKVGVRHVGILVRGTNAAQVRSPNLFRRNDRGVGFRVAPVADFSKRREFQKFRGIQYRHLFPGVFGFGGQLFQDGNGVTAAKLDGRLQCSRSDLRLGILQACDDSPK